MNYSSLAESIHATQVPADWSVVISDIKGSTALMRSGRQTDVNLVGAGCIAAVRNRFTPREVPYVFGGDGATFLVPKILLADVMRILSRVRVSTRKNYSMELRVDSITVEELYARKAKLALGFLESRTQEVFPYFRGNGIALADQLIKERWQKEEERTHTEIAEAPDLRGLGCFHSPFESQRGKILSLIIEFRDPASEELILKDIFRSLLEEGSLDRLRPVQVQNLKRSWQGKVWGPSSSSQLATWKVSVQRLYEMTRIGLGKVLFHVDRYGFWNGRTSSYTQRLVQQSDWIKMDGALRMVLDVNSRDEAKLIRLLDSYYQSSDIYFGTHSSDTALMTCHLKSREGEQHTHFIDGDKGGLTFAAIQLKEQKKMELQASA